MIFLVYSSNLEIDGLAPLVKDTLHARSGKIKRKIRKSRQGSPPIGKIHQFIKIVITLEPVMLFGCPLRFRISLRFVKLSILGLTTPSSTIRVWLCRKDIFTRDDLVN